MKTIKILENGLFGLAVCGGGLLTYFAQDVMGGAPAAFLVLFVVLSAYAAGIVAGRRMS